MANTLKLGLREFIYDVYKIDVDEMCDYDNFCFYSCHSENDLTREEIELAQTAFPNLTESSCLKLLTDTHDRLYEMNYISEYSDKLLNAIEDKLNRDIPQMINFFREDLKELKVKGTASDLTFKIDWAKDTITFKGKLSLLDGCILQVINDYGMFGYDGVAGFRYACGNIKERIKGHIHWLKYTEDIYGTIYDLFRLNTDGLGDYIYPLTSIDLEALKETYDMDIYEEVV